MFFNRLSVLLLAASVSASVFAAPSKPEPPKSGEERPDDVICETVTPIGSHIKRRICATRQAREEQRKASESDMERVKRGSGKPRSNKAAEPSF